MNPLLGILENEMKEIYCLELTLERVPKELRFHQARVDRLLEVDPTLKAYSFENGHLVLEGGQSRIVFANPQERKLTQEE